jgi:small subunit ribosomal protein S16
LPFEQKPNNNQFRGKDIMALTIRLTRMGSKKRPFYRLVVLERASRRDGRPLEFLGHYNPMTDPAEVVIDSANYEKWIKLGATPSDTVRSLVAKKSA